MSYEEAEAAVEEAAEAAETAIEWSVSPDALVAASKLGVAPTMRRVGRARGPRPRPRASDPHPVPRRHPDRDAQGARWRCPFEGTVVALIRKGMRLTRERYVADPYPDAWVPMKELRTAERCVVPTATPAGTARPGSPGRQRHAAVRVAARAPGPRDDRPARPADRAWADRNGRRTRRRGGARSIARC